MQFGQTQFGSLPQVTKNLLIINGLFFLGKILEIGIDFDRLFSLYQFQSVNFMPYQLITHMFMHADFTHLLFNMFALFMFGRVLESVWGPKRFLTYYILTGLGAAFIYIGYIQYQANNTYKKIDNKKEIEICEVATTIKGKYIYQQWRGEPCQNINMDILEHIKKNDISNDKSYLKQNKSGQKDFHKEANQLNKLINTGMLGASGAVYGLLLAFGMLFPNTELYLMFIPIPIKAKYLVIGLAALALFGGINNHPGDNIAHFAHLGGMIFGFILLKIWQKNRNTFY